MTIPGTKWWTWLSPTWRLRNGPQVPRWRMTWVENRTIPAVIDVRAQEVEQRVLAPRAALVAGDRDGRRSRAPPRCPTSTTPDALARPRGRPAPPDAHDLATQHRARQAERAGTEREGAALVAQRAGGSVVIATVRAGRPPGTSRTMRAGTPHTTLCGRDVARDDRARGDEGLLADLDARQDHRAAAHATRATQAGARHRVVRRAARHRVVVRRHRAGADEDVVVDLGERGDVDVGLQPDARADHDVVVDRRRAADHGVGADRACARARTPGRR